MSTNISKQKREDLLKKIKAIRTYISAAPQDENTGNLLSYLSDLEKDVNGKKYGLIFEEHREEIDEVLDTHTPILTENTALFVNNGGQMNFIIEEKSTDNSLEGLKFCITGSFIQSRDSLRKALEDRGAKFISSVSKNLDVLFCGDKAGSKLTKAQQLGVRVANEEELIFNTK